MAFGTTIALTIQQVKNLAFPASLSNSLDPAAHSDFKQDPDPSQTNKDSKHWQLLYRNNSERGWGHCCHIAENSDILLKSSKNIIFAGESY